MSAHSLGADGAQSSATENIKLNDNSTTKRTPPMPAFDQSKPHEWLDALDKWFIESRITDSWITYSLVATTQPPSSYAILRANVRDSPHRDPYGLAKKFILQQNSYSSPDEYDTVVYRSPTRPKSERSNAVTTQTLQQLQEMLMAEIRAIRFDIEELRTPRPSRARRSNSRPPPNNPSTTADANEPAICWYHTEYGRHARLCRAPCKYRS